ncbi:hypothetical protein [Streptomyces sp. NPDC048445]|uniref:hypothetical protein n=1 Tax=Streptomyces sp. NPDC048445 TaxID=3365553 RepID=UPI00371A54C8
MPHTTGAHRRGDRGYELVRRQRDGIRARTCTRLRAKADVNFWVLGDVHRGRGQQCLAIIECRIE